MPVKQKKLGADRQSILQMVGTRASALRSKAKQQPDGGESIYAAQVLEALHGDISQSLDRDDTVEKE